MMHLEEALEELYGLSCKKPENDHRTPLVLTFDDGYYDNYTVGFALARELQIPITIFLIPGYLGSKKNFWWREGERLARLAQITNVSIDGHAYCLKQEADRELIAQAIDAHLRHARSVAEREAFLNDILHILAVPRLAAGEEEALRPLNWIEVREMEESGLVSFGGQTMHHPILAYLESHEEVKREVKVCRDVLEQQLSHPVRIFAYPVGRDEHIGKEALKAVREAGYAWAVTTTSGITNPQNDPYHLPRILGDVSRHWLVMAAEVSGIWRIFSPLWKWKDNSTY
jgi:peptidoglycan/xylan/chitin deacetylase (PgdA/CDA1 family)